MLHLLAINLSSFQKAIKIASIKANYIIYADITCQVNDPKIHQMTVLQLLMTMA